MGERGVLYLQDYHPPLLKALVVAPSGRDRFKIIPLFQSMVKIVLFWPCVTHSYLVLNNCVVQSFSILCPNLLVKVPKVVQITKFGPKWSRSSNSDQRDPKCANIRSSALVVLLIFLPFPQYFLIGSEVGCHVINHDLI